MDKPRIGVVSLFQNGKSTLVNALLHARVAPTGEGVIKPRTTVRYCYAEDSRYVRLHPSGREEELDRRAACEAILTPPEEQETELVLYLKSELLRHIDLVDTPGFNADEQDRQTTIQALQKLDGVVFLLGGGLLHGNLNEAEQDVLNLLEEMNLPYMVWYNCHDRGRWDPLSEEVGVCIESLDATFRGLGAHAVPVDVDGVVLPINLAWYWSALESSEAIRFELFDADEAQKRLTRDVKNSFYDEDLGRVVLPDASTLASMANCQWLARYLVVFAAGLSRLPVPELELTEQDDMLLARAQAPSATSVDYEFWRRYDDSDAWSVTVEKEPHIVLPLTRNVKVCHVRVRLYDPVSGKTSEFSRTETIKRRYVASVVVSFGSGRGGVFD